MVTGREPAHEHLANAVQVLMSLIEDAGDLNSSFLRDDVQNALIDVRNRIEAAQGLISEVKEAALGLDPSLVPGLRRAVKELL